jgi:hypothetical protein
MVKQASKGANKKKANGFFFCIFVKSFRSGGDENERQIK